MTTKAEQERICQNHDSGWVAAPDNLKVGIALHTLDLLPLNGLRHPPESGTTGWFIWGGTELPPDADFFAPLCVAHLADKCPKVLPYLGLAPGYRFLVDHDGYEDVWFDEKLLHEPAA